MQLSIRIVEELILPTLRAIENDLYPGIANPTKSRIYAQLRELIEEMTVEIPAEPEQPPEQSTSGQPGIVIMPFMGEDDLIGGKRYCALAGSRRDQHAFAFLAHSSRREGGTAEGTKKFHVDFALGDRVKIG